MENPKSNLWYNKNLKRFAQENRADMTKAEAYLWKYVLSGRRICGYQFRRQRPVLNYIADFMSKELMLIIEVDGNTHQWEEVADPPPTPASGGHWADNPSFQFTNITIFARTPLRPAILNS